MAVDEESVRISAQDDVETVRDSILSVLRDGPHLGRARTGTSVAEIRRALVNDGRLPAEMEVVFFAALWSLVRNGIIVPGSPGTSNDIPINENHAKFPMFATTPFGREVLTAPGTVHPLRFDAFLRDARNRLGDADEAIYAYLAEAVGTNRRGYHLAALVMLGVSAELLMVWLIRRFMGHLEKSQRESGEKLFQKHFLHTTRLAKTFIGHFLDHLRSEPGFHKGLVSRSESNLDVLLSLIRVNRNEIGHGRPQTADAQLVTGELQIYLALLSLARELADAFIAQECSIGRL